MGITLNFYNDMDLTSAVLSAGQDGDINFHSSFVNLYDCDLNTGSFGLSANSKVNVQGGSITTPVSLENDINFHDASKFEKFKFNTSNDEFEILSKLGYVKLEQSVYRNASPVSSSIKFVLNSLTADEYTNYSFLNLGVSTSFRKGFDPQQIYIQSTNTQLECYFAIHPTGTSSLTTEHIWVELDYYKTNNVFTRATSRGTAVLTSDSVNTWQGLATDHYKITLPITTPQECIGQFRFNVLHTSGSTITIYLDPKVVIT